MTVDRTNEGIPYEYTNRDLLCDPESYEYSQVHGPEFINAYYVDRARTLRSLDNSIGDTKPREESPWQGTVQALQWADTESALEELPPVDDIARQSDRVGSTTPRTPRLPVAGTTDVNETVPLLLALAGYPFEEPPDTENAVRWLDEFTTRFEVKKRLFESYDSEMNPINDQLAPIWAYPLLDVVTLVNYGRTGNLKYLNLALKIGDLLSSRAGKISTQLTLTLSKYAIDEERGYIGELVEEKGLTV